MSLLINYMPPRITRKSYRPRASDRTMVDNLQPRSLSCFRIRKRRHENRMDLRRANTPEPLNMTWAGDRSEQPRSLQSPVMFFLLTLPFIERACVDRMGRIYQMVRNAELVLVTPIRVRKSRNFLLNTCSAINCFRCDR